MVTRMLIEWDDTEVSSKIVGRRAELRLSLLNDKNFRCAHDKFGFGDSTQWRKRGVCVAPDG
jgi:hypothetical protein